MVYVPAPRLDINYHETESNNTGDKQDYVTHSLDFEEILWTFGYSEMIIPELCADARITVNGKLQTPKYKLISEILMKITMDGMRRGAAFYAQFWDG